MKSGGRNDPAKQNSLQKDQKQGFHSGTSMRWMGDVEGCSLEDRKGSGVNVPGTERGREWTGRKKYEFLTGRNELAVPYVILGFHQQLHASGGAISYRRREMS